MLFSCISENKNQVYIFKQWHLSPNDRSTEIEKSKSFPQYENQVEIYKEVSKLVESGKTQLILAEGCEGEINKMFRPIFNGWSMGRLDRYKDDPKFSEILAPIPFKLKVKFPNLKVLCGDNLELIKENQKAMSDLRGFTGFYTRLMDLQKTDKVQYKVYVNQLQSLYPDEKISSPIQFTLDKSLKSLKMFERLIKERNHYFEKLAVKYKEASPVIIIGGLHTKDLVERFRKNQVNSNVITPKGYKDDEMKLIRLLKKNLEDGAKALVKFFQVPAGFNISLFPFSNLIDPKNIADVKDWDYMKGLVKKKVSEKILNSDFDKDGIRDFTLSTNGEMLIITSEDRDWDNDGIENIIDPTVGTTKVALIEKIHVNNHYFSTAKIEKMKKDLNKELTLVSKDASHELIILEVLQKLFLMLKSDSFEIDYLVATKPVFSYGEKVFFSYIKGSKAIEYYPEKLNKYINDQYQLRFKTVPFEKYINSFVVPIIVHSLSHEMAHSLKIDESKIRNLAKNAGWTWSKKNVENRYLRENREPIKVMKENYYKERFLSKEYKDWLKGYEIYKREVSRFLNEKDKVKKKKILEESPFKTELKSRVDEHQLSFFKNDGIISLYALSQVKEWFAESYSMCVYKKVYPGSNTEIRSIELEHLIGIRPISVSNKFCANFSL